MLKYSSLRGLLLEKWHPCAWIILGCFFLYFKTLAFRFTYFDDNQLILDNLWFLQDWRNAVSAFTQGVFLGGEELFFRPILTLSFIIDAHIGGASPVVYHFTNILLHAAASSLVFHFFGRIGYGRRAAFIAALFFMVHPALSQAVAWIPGRNDTLLAVFVLMSFSAFIHFVNNRTAPALFLHLLCFNLALYSKETALQLVPLCLVYFWFFSKKPFMPSQWIHLLSGWGLSCAIWFAMRSSSTVSASAETFSKNDVLMSLKEVPLSLAHYIGKIIFPFNLSGFPITQDTGSLFGFLALLILSAAFIFTDCARKRHSLFGFIWFLLFMLPPFLLLDTTRLEHRLYLPIIGIFIMLSEFIHSHNAVFSRKIFLTAAGSVILLFSGITFVHSDIFLSRLSFWENAVRHSPHSSNAHNCLGVRFIEYNKKELAEQEFLRAIALSPGNINAVINIAGIYMEKGDYEKADKALASALQWKPHQYLAWYNLGLLRFLQGNDEVARRCWEKTLEYNPNYYYAWRTLAVFHHLRGEEAAGAYFGKCRDTFKRPVAVPATATLKDRQWLYKFSLTEEPQALPLM